MTGKPLEWFAVSAAVAPEYTDAVESAFNALDSIGSQIDLMPKADAGLCTVTAYFLSAPDDDVLDTELKLAARSHGLSAEIDISVTRSVVVDQDWLAEWKKHWKPVGQGRFIVAAPWHDIEDGERTIIRIEPSMAFGTGTHETTQLCLAAIDQLYRPAMSFLDVGTGTGLLAIAAASIAAVDASVSAVDIDPVAVGIARSNAEMNGVGGRIEFHTGSIDAVSGLFDLVCANLTADVIIPIIPELLDSARSILVLSGILAEQERLVSEAIPRHLDTTVTAAGEWIAMIIRK